MGDKAYRHISPVIAHDAQNRVTAILRASLVNRPNLIGLTALHQEEATMDLIAKLRQALGLPDTADEATVLAAVNQRQALQAAGSTALGAIAKAAGLAADATGDAVLQAVQVLADPAKTVPAAHVIALQAQFTELQQNVAKKEATRFIDAAIKAGKVGLRPLRDHYIARHMQDPAGVEKEVGAMIALNGNSRLPADPPGGGAAALSDTDREVIALMGISEEAFKKQRALEGQREEAI